MVWRSGSSIYRVSATKIFLDFATIMRIPRIKCMEQAFMNGFQGEPRVAPLAGIVGGILSGPCTALAFGGMCTFNEFTTDHHATRYVGKRNRVVQEGCSLVLQEIQPSQKRDSLKTKICNFVRLANCAGVRIGTLQWIHRS